MWGCAIFWFTGKWELSASIPGEGRGLKALNLSGLKDKLSDATVNMLGKGRYTNIESADLSGCEQVNETALAIIARNCPRLKSVRVMGTQMATQFKGGGVTEWRVLGLTGMEICSRSGCGSLFTPTLNSDTSCRFVKHLAQPSLP